MNLAENIGNVSESLEYKEENDKNYLISVVVYYFCKRLKERDLIFVTF